MGITISDLLIRVRADTANATQNLGDTGQKLAGLGTIGAVAGTTVALAAIAIGTATMKMAGDFQAGMTSLITGAGESEANIGMVSKAVLQMAVDTGTSTAQLTAGMFMIESAGYHGAAGLDVLKAAAEGAKVGNADLGTVADATTTILKDYPNVVNGAAGAVNGLIATVANGKTHMQDLSQSLAMVLPTASAAGIGLSDVEAAMATMTGEGVPAANAATYLRQTIIALEAPGKKAKDTLASLGISTSDLASAMQKSLPDALQMITDAVGKKFPVGSAAYVAAIKDITGGSKTMQGMLDLTGGHMTDFTNNMIKISGTAVNSGQSIQGWSNVQGDFNHKIDQAKAVIETLGIKIGTALLPVAGQAVDMFKNLLPKAFDAAKQAADRIGQGIEYIKTHSDQMRPILAGVAAVIATVMVAAFYSWAAAAWSAAAAVIAATWPVLAIAAAIGLLVAGIVWAYQNWGFFKTAVDTVRNVLGFLKDRIGDVMGVLGPIIGKFMEWHGWLQDKVYGAVGRLMNKIGEFIGQMVTKAQPAIKNVSEKLAELHSWFNDKVLPVLRQLYAYFEANILPVLQRVGNWIETQVVTHLQTLWDKIQKNILPILGQLAGFLAGQMGKNLQSFGDHLNTVLTIIGNILGALGRLRDALSNLHFPDMSKFHIPGFAEGGVTPGGVALVGEHGPELAMFPQGTRIIPNTQTAALMSAGTPAGGGGSSSSGGSGGGSGAGGYGTQVIVVELDGSVLTRGVLKHMPKEARLATGQRI